MIVIEVDMRKWFVGLARVSYRLQSLGSVDGTLFMCVCASCERLFEYSR